MKVLISAVACDPERGSESYVGWAAVDALSAHHDLWVLTSSYGKRAVENALATHPNRGRIHMRFLGKPMQWHQNRLLARAQDWREYLRWTQAARAESVRLQSRVGFDLAHHVTYATWRVRPPFAEMNLPVVWGPVGGGEIFPSRLEPVLSVSSRWFERSRVLSNALAVRSLPLRRAAEEAAHIFANNRETQAMLLGLGARSENVSILSQSFFSPEKMSRFVMTSPKKPPGGGPLRIFAGGNLEGRKGVALALDALSILRQRGVNFLFTFGGIGPELSHLREKAEQLGLSDRVTLGMHFHGDEYLRVLREAHVYLLPSLREGAPLTMLEAMLSGCVPVVADCGGAAMAVDAECGFCIRVTDADRMARGLADGLESMAADPAKWSAMSARSAAKSGKIAGREYYLNHMLAAYEKAALRG